MKSERRHELEQNELADWTIQFIEKIKPYTNVIVGGTIAVVILAVGITLWTRQARFASETAWSMYYAGLSADNSETMQKIVADFPRTEATRWAIVAEGDMHLRKGCELFFTDKIGGTEELDAAIECYKAAQNSENPMLDERAAFGLARAYESQGNLAEAKFAYETVQKKWENGVYSLIVEERLNSISKKSTKDFYDLFAKYEPELKEKPPIGDIPSYESTEVPTPEKNFVEGIQVEGVDKTVIVEPKIETEKTELPKFEDLKMVLPLKGDDSKAETSKEEPQKKEATEKAE